MRIMTYIELWMNLKFKRPCFVDVSNIILLYYNDIDPDPPYNHGKRWESTEATFVLAIDWRDERAKAYTARSLNRNIKIAGQKAP